MSHSNHDDSAPLGHWTSWTQRPAGNPVAATDTAVPSTRSAAGVSVMAAAAAVTGGPAGGGGGGGPAVGGAGMVGIVPPGPVPSPVPSGPGPVPSVVGVDGAVASPGGVAAVAGGVATVVSHGGSPLVDVVVDVV